MTTVTITIKRPNGNIETVDMSHKFPVGLSDQMFERIKKANADAGAGECLSYNVDHSIDADTQAMIDADTKKAQWFAKHGFNPNDAS